MRIYSVCRLNLKILYRYMHESLCSEGLNFHFIASEELFVIIITIIVSKR